jgi:hypothetical protein
MLPISNVQFIYFNTTHNYVIYSVTKINNHKKFLFCFVITLQLVNHRNKDLATSSHSFQLPLLVILRMEIPLNNPCAIFSLVLKAIKCFAAERENYKFPTTRIDLLQSKFLVCHVCQRSLVDCSPVFVGVISHS